VITENRGRPNKITNTNLRKAIIKLAEKNTLTYVMKYLATKGIKYQPKPGAKSVTEKIKITLPTLSKMCKDDAGIYFERGRPCK